MDLTKLVLEDFQVVNYFSLLSFETRVCDQTKVVMVDLVYRDEACIEHQLTTTLDSVISDEAKSRLKIKDDYTVVKNLMDRLETDQVIRLSSEESVIMLRSIDVDEAEEGMGERSLLGEEEEKLLVKGSLYFPGTKTGYINFLKLAFFNDGWRLSKD